MQGRPLCRPCCVRGFMKRYLGSKETAFSAVVTPIFVCFPIGLSAVLIWTEISAATIVLALGGVLCSLVWGVYLRKIVTQLYSWGDFQNNGVTVKTAFHQSANIAYVKCKSAGIGFYTHGIFNSKRGPKSWFVFLSYNVFDETYRENMNLWKPFHDGIKVRFDEKLYRYLLTVLPEKQSKMLRQDYIKYFK